MIEYITIIVLLILLIISVSSNVSLARRMDKLRKNINKTDITEINEDFIKSLNVLVNNNPSMSGLAYYRDNGYTNTGCLVLDIPTKQLLFIKSDYVYSLHSHIKFKVNIVDTQEIKITLIDGTIISFVDNCSKFAYSKFMIWYYSRDSLTFGFVHTKGFTTLRRDLIKYIEFHRL